MRWAVLEALYESEASGHDAETAFNRRLRELADDDGELLEHAPKSFGLGMLRGVLARKREFDDRIARAAPRFPVASMAIVDRNILRLAIWELVTHTSAPTGAVVNEAVELARRYGGERTPGFVNGVLRTIAEDVAAAQAGDGTPQEPEIPNPTQQENP
ncbi:MAG: transcription antitermination factor NusB [Dehalococcoidia bacterium]|nr:transcription antitermination factor NusB [Dehalococcoidia bacterium]